MSAPAYDVAVVGAGPVGLAVAIGLARRGASVVAFDRALPPIDKPCGEGLMPEGVACLRRLGVEPEAIVSWPLAGLRFLDGETVLDAPFAEPLAGRGIRRTTLHAALALRAEETGVALRWGESVHGVSASVGAAGAELEAAGGRVRAGTVVAADGLRSPLRQRFGLERPGAPRRGARSRFGLVRHYRAVPWSDRVEIHFGSESTAYVTPVGPGEVGVAMLWTAAASRGPVEAPRAPGSGAASPPGRSPVVASAAKFDRLLAEHTRLCDRLGDRPATGPDRGAGPLERRVRARHRGPIALVGDAAGYVDALTGEGLTLGFRQAERLAALVAEGRLDRWNRQAARLAARPDAMARAMLFVEARPALRRRLALELAGAPAILAGLVALHTAADRPLLASLGVVGAARLASWFALAALRGECRRRVRPSGTARAPSASRPGPVVR